MTLPTFYDAQTIEAHLDYPGCIGAMRDAMTWLSAESGAQPLRQIMRLADHAAFGVMPGDLANRNCFGAKLASVFGDPSRPGRARHRGIVALFDRQTGAPLCLADAEAITTIRTACATAAATDALARPDARCLAIFGTGAQAAAHLRALTHVRQFAEILVWGRDPARTAAFVEQMRPVTDTPLVAMTDGRQAASRADVICTVTGARDPVLMGAWVRAGTHVNLVGSSMPGPVEADTALVAAARYIADYRPSALAQASEFLVARQAGVIDDDHIVGEIGAVFAGRLAGREHSAQVTLYKSLGHIVQDLAAVAYVHARVGSTSSIGIDT
jgi:ornithine cyclodeaminase